jgi:hypothetical protein
MAAVKAILGLEKRKESKMTTYTEYLFQVERRKAEVRQAERDYLRYQIAGHSVSTWKGYQRLLARLGELLATWGCQLQMRYLTEGRASPC